MNHQDNTVNKPTIWAVIPTAGIGRRMASTKPKQYLKLKGKTIIEHSLGQLSKCNAVSGIAVGIAESDSYWQKLNIKNKKFLGTYIGGSQRIHTVLNGLDYLSQWVGEQDWVMVHDAVRPCVRVEDIDLLVEHALRLNQSAILASPVIDTVKKINANAEIQTTLNRDVLMLAMTPQLFPFKLLQKALKSAIDKDIVSTDESAAVEILGLQPLAITGQRSNIKITTAEDLQIANLFLDDHN